MEIRTKFAIGQLVKTNEEQNGEVVGIECGIDRTDEVNMLYVVDTDEGTEDYFESELTAVIEQDHVICTKYGLGQMVYAVLGDKVYRGTIKKILLSHKQDDPEIEYEIGDYSPHVALETDADIYAIGEESKIIERITNNID